MNGCKIKTSYRAFHTSGIKTDKEGLPCKRKKKIKKHQETAWTAYGKKKQKALPPRLYPYPICKCFCHIQACLFHN